MNRKFMQIQENSSLKCHSELCSEFSCYKGFTLLETIIVLAIMTTFFAISIPLFSKFTEKMKLDTTARSVVSALRTARTCAIANNADYYVFFVTIDGQASYYISSEDETAPAAPAGVEDKIYKLPDSFSFGALTGFTGSRVVFRPTGGVDVAGAIPITDGANTETISVELTTGRARIE